jgi:hypothetical protein
VNEFAVDDHAWRAHYPGRGDVLQPLDLFEVDLDPASPGDVFDQLCRRLAVAAAGAQDLDLFHRFLPALRREQRASGRECERSHRPDRPLGCEAQPIATRMWRTLAPHTSYRTVSQRAVT